MEQMIISFVSMRNFKRLSLVSSDPIILSSDRKMHIVLRFMEVDYHFIR